MQQSSEAVRGHPRKAFLLRIAGCSLEHEFTMPGGSTLADLACAAVAAAKLHLGLDACVELHGLPASDPSLRLDDLKLKAPHVLTAARVAAHALSPRALVARSGASALSLRDIDEAAVAWSDDEGLEARIATRVRAYSSYLELSTPDSAKKTLVLDVRASATCRTIEAPSRALGAGRVLAVRCCAHTPRPSLLLLLLRIVIATPR